MAFLLRLSAVTDVMLVTSSGSVAVLMPIELRSKVAVSLTHPSRREYSFRYIKTPDMPCLITSTGGTERQSSRPSKSISLRLAHRMSSAGSDRSGLRATARILSCASLPRLLGRAMSWLF